MLEHTFQEGGPEIQALLHILAIPFGLFQRLEMIERVPPCLLRVRNEAMCWRPDIAVPGDLPLASQVKASLAVDGLQHFVKDMLKPNKLGLQNRHNPSALIAWRVVW